MKKKKQRRAGERCKSKLALTSPAQGSDLHTGHLCSLAPANHASGVVSSSFASTVDTSSSLTMSENFQNRPFLGNSDSLHLSLPLVSNATSLTGSVCNFSRVPAPAVSSAWLLPSASGTSYKPPMGNAYLYQHAGATTLSGGAGQSQISTSTACNPGTFEWAITGGSKKKPSSLRDFNVTVIDQETAISSLSMASQYDTTSDATNMHHLCPSLSAQVVQAAPSQTANQEHGLSLPYQGVIQGYYCNQGPLGLLPSGELSPYLQSYGSVVSYMESRASVPQPELIMVLKEIQPTNMIPPASMSGIYSSVSAQPTTQTSFQVMESSLGMETSLGLQPPSQTFCLPQTPDFPKSCTSRNIQILESKPLPALGDISIIAPVQSSSNLLALPPSPSQEQEENKNLDDINNNLSKPLDAYHFPIGIQDSPLLPLEVPDIHQLLASIDPLLSEKQPDCENDDLGKNSLSLKYSPKNKETLEYGTEYNDSFADIATLVEDIHLPQVLNSLDDLDQSKGPKEVKIKNTRALKLNELQENSSVIKALDQARKNKHKASETISGVPKDKIKRESPDCVCLGEVGICNAAASDGAPESTAKHPNSKPQKAASSRNRKTKSHGQEKNKRNKYSSKKGEESKQSGKKLKTEEKSTIPKMKRKKNQPELTQETFKKPRTHLGMQMLESVQVFHALGKRLDKKTELSSSRALGNSSNPKCPQSPPLTKRWLDTLSEGKGPEKTQLICQKPDGSAEKECSSPSQYELPPPGKVKLVPLPFLNLDKPQTRPVPRRPLSLASRRPAVANPGQPGFSSAQPAATNSSGPTPASLTGPARPDQPISSSSSQPTLTSPARPGLTNTTCSSVPQSAAPRPATYKTSACTSSQREPIRIAVTKPLTPPRPQNQYLLQDFALQPNPWKKPTVLGPVMSKPITDEQRPEREAMKRMAQLERENAAKYTSLGKVQYFIEREKEMEISRYYGYAI
ncbi:LOW QUALITY PROTEIN: uncharacterized protein C2orf78-like [Phyllostomus discolor]|uniref:LOW QUALITY PROTEIN: uncharacterized protein C2orf78-like n=1 Tax=Phyllostomus discolor TaxID=89673 RepID=A0A6J2LSJ0_9CHIR|nr:LOW QUALITY PROTEIN: uncharacterized protein C2orf78-like [Phyllostomus discolor]